MYGYVLRGGEVEHRYGSTIIKRVTALPSFSCVTVSSIIGTGRIWPKLASRLNDSLE